MFDVNVPGVYNAVIAFLPALERAAAAGEVAHIVNTGSENSVALPAMGPFTAYTATKHAVLGMSDGLRRDLEGTGIGVSIICPGLVGPTSETPSAPGRSVFGGAREAPAETAAAMEPGRTVEATAETVFERLAADEFMIITDPCIRSLTLTRLEEVSRALQAADARVPGL